MIKRNLELIVKGAVIGGTMLIPGVSGGTMAMVVGVIVVDTYLIVISYLDTNLAHQLALANLSTEELQKRASGQIGGDSA